MPNDKLKQFYSAVKQNKNITGIPDDYNVFERTMNDPAKAELFFNSISQNKNITGLPDNFDAFSGSLGLKKKDQSQNSPKPAPKPTKPSSNTTDDYQWSSGGTTVTQKPKVTTPNVYIAATIQPVKKPVVSTPTQINSRLKMSQAAEMMSLTTYQWNNPPQNEQQAAEYKAKINELKARHQAELALPDDKKEEYINTKYNVSKAKKIESTIQEYSKANKDIKKLELALAATKNAKVEVWDIRGNEIQAQAVADLEAKIAEKKKIQTQLWYSGYENYSGITSFYDSLSEDVKTYEDFAQNGVLNEVESADYQSKKNQLETMKVLSDSYKELFPKIEPEYAETTSEKMNSAISTFHESVASIIDIPANLTAIGAQAMNDYVTDPIIRGITGKPWVDTDIMMPGSLGDKYKEMLRLDEVKPLNPDDVGWRTMQGMFGIAPDLMLLYATAGTGNALSVGTKAAQSTKQLESLYKISTGVGWQFPLLGGTKAFTESMMSKIEAGEEIDGNDYLEGFVKFGETAAEYASYEMMGIAGAAAGSKVANAILTKSGTLRNVASIAAGEATNLTVQGGLFGSSAALNEYIDTGDVQSNNVYTAVGQAFTMYGYGKMKAISSMYSNAAKTVYAADKKVIEKYAQNDKLTVSDLNELEMWIADQIVMRKNNNIPHQDLDVALTNTQTIRNIKMMAELPIEMVENALTSVKHPTPEMAKQQVEKIEILRNNKKQIENEIKETEVPKVTESGEQGVDGMRTKTDETKTVEESKEITKPEEVVQEIPTPQKITVMGEDIDVYTNFIPTKENVDVNASYRFTGESKNEIPEMLRDKATVNKSEITVKGIIGKGKTVKSETWSVSINGADLIKMYEKQVKETEVKPLQETSVASDKSSISDKLNKLADAIEKGKINKGSLRSSTGLDLAWDSAVTIVAKSIRGGANLSKAISDGIEHIQNSDYYKESKQSIKNLMERNFRKAIRDTYKSQGGTDKEIEGYVVEHSNELTSQAKKLLNKAAKEIKTGNEKIEDLKDGKELIKTSTRALSNINMSLVSIASKGKSIKINKDIRRINSIMNDIQKGGYKSYTSFAEAMKEAVTIADKAYAKYELNNAIETVSKNTATKGTLPADKSYFETLKKELDVLNANYDTEFKRKEEIGDSDYMIEKNSEINRNIDIEMQKAEEYLNNEDLINAEKIYSKITALDKSRKFYEMDYTSSKAATKEIQENYKEAREKFKDIATKRAERKEKVITESLASLKEGQTKVTSNFKDVLEAPIRAFKSFRNSGRDTPWNIFAFYEKGTFGEGAAHKYGAKGGLNANMTYMERMEKITEALKEAGDKSGIGIIDTAVSLLPHEKTGIMMNKLDVNGNPTGKKIDLVDYAGAKLTKAGLGFLYATNRNKTELQKFKKAGADAETLKQLEDFIGEEIRDYAVACMDLMKKKHIEYNQASVDKKGYEIGFVDDYMTAIRKESALDILQGDVSSLSTASRYSKERVKTNLLVDFVNNNIYSVPDKYFKAMEREMAYFDYEQDMRAYFGSNRIKERLDRIDKTLYKRQYKFVLDNINLNKQSKDPIDKKADYLSGATSIGGVIGAPFTALKQTAGASIMTTLADVGNEARFAAEQSANMVNPYMWYKNHKFFMDNNVIYRERIRNSSAGNDQINTLLNRLSSQKSIKASDLFGIVSAEAVKLGMTPNVVMDAITLTSGLKPYYNQQYRKYRKLYSDKEAKNMANFDAAVAINTKNASAHPMFRSAMQNNSIAKTLIPYMNAQLNMGRELEVSAHNLRASADVYKKTYNSTFDKFKAEEENNKGKALTAQELELVRKNARAIALKKATSGSFKGVRDMLLIGSTAPLFAWMSLEIPSMWKDDDEETRKKNMETVRNAAYYGTLYNIPIAGSIIQNAVEGYDPTKPAVPKMYHDLAIDLGEIYRAWKESDNYTVNSLFTARMMIDYGTGINTNLLINQWEAIDNMRKEGYSDEDMMKLLAMPKTRKRHVPEFEPSESYVEKEMDKRLEKRKDKMVTTEEEAKESKEKKFKKNEKEMKIRQKAEESGIPYYPTTMGRPKRTDGRPKRPKR